MPSATSHQRQPQPGVKLRTGLKSNNKRQSLHTQGGAQRDLYFNGLLHITTYELLSLPHSLNILDSALFGPVPGQDAPCPLLNSDSQFL